MSGLPRSAVSLLVLTSVAVVPVVATMTASAAASAHVWRSHSLPPTPRSGQDTPYVPTAVSCPTSSWCMTVGAYGRVSSKDVGTGSYAYSVVSRANRLTNKPVQSPASLRADDVSQVSALSSVSCLSPSFCLAVGAYNRHYPGHAKTDGDAAAGLAERWNGHRWSSVPVPQATPRVTGTTRNAFTLASVSCTSRAFCVAVGQHTSQAGGGMLAMTYNGKRWRQSRLPKVVNNTRRSGQAALAAVSCSTTSRCLAVGTSVTGFPRVEQRTRNGWHALAVPAKLGDERPAALSSVSCASSSFCLIGVNSSVTGRSTLLGELSGGQIHQVRVTGPKRTDGLDLYQVACTSADSCVALGTRQARRGDEDYPVAAVEHIHSARSSPASHRGLADAYVIGMSCLSTTRCTAVGRKNNVPEGYYGTLT
jgi:hypothetical protein